MTDTGRDPETLMRDAGALALAERSRDGPRDMVPLAFAERGSLFVPTGDTGLARYGGVIQDEPVWRLRGPRWHRVVRAMLHSPVVKGMLMAVEMLIRQAEWQLDPADDGGTEAQDTADFVESCRRDLWTSWDDTLAQVLSFLPYGFSLFEIVLKRRLGPGGRQPSAFDDGLIGWDDWQPRAQETVTRWRFDRYGRAEAFEQQAPMLSRPVTIPLSRCLHFRAGGYRGSPEGESVLRAVYVDWDGVNKIQLIEAIGIERDLAGLPVFRIPAGLMDPNGTPAQAAAYESYKTMGVNLRQGDQAVVILPSERDDAGNLQYDLTLLSTGGQRQFDTSAVTTRRTTQMTMALLADWLMVGHGRTGSFALSQSKTALFTKAIAAWLSVIADTINGQAIRPLLRANGIDARLAPTLRPGALDETDLGGTAEFVQKLLPLITTLNRDRKSVV